MSSIILEPESPQITYYLSGRFSNHVKVGSSSTSNAPQPSYSLRRRVQKVSKRAALASRKIWDSNDASIDAAQSAVDKWEHSYRGMRSFLIHSSKQCLGVYNATKSASGKIEHSFLVPIRDMVLLPAFNGIEQAVGTTVGFLQSEEAGNVAETTLQLVKRTPFIGESILAPSIVTSAAIMKSAWDVAKYPIPSRENVRYSVDTILDFTKWAISSGSREIYFYAKLVDATVTRVLYNTQWRVLGSGPYSTLNEVNKLEVIDHLCERYLSLENHIARYELAAHIEHENKELYHDLISSGLLYGRGGDVTSNDIWLLSNPAYRSSDVKQYLIIDSFERKEHYIQPLWFYLPNQNGKKPGKDSKWRCFDERDRKCLEKKFVSSLHEFASTVSDCSEEKKEDSKLDSTTARVLDDSDGYLMDRTKWYNPDLNDDILVDQKRHAVSFFRSSNSDSNKFPNILMRMYPTLWRFYGDGNDVRRGVWLMDTQRHGLQPYSEESTAILEDAFLFLKWKKCNDHGMTGGIDTILLTVQVDGPDGEEQLVQFRSLTQVTAIQKTLGGGLALFKRRVYRGASIDDVDFTAECSTGSMGSNTDHSTIEDEGSLLAAPKILSSVCIEACDENQQDTTADHLILVVHGIGEMLRTSEVFGLSLPPLTSSIVDCCASLRKNHSEVVAAHNSANSTFVPRAEYLPIEWHENFFHSSRQKATTNPCNLETGSYTTLKDISLTTIPHLRNFANDTLLDILYFMSPDYHDIIIDIVCSELNIVVEKYKSLTGFNGNISLLSHSLGSVISWDILSNQKSKSRSDHKRIPFHDILSFPSRSRNTQQRRTSSTKLYPYPHLNFDVSHSFMIGSPVAVFLMLRGQSTDPFSIDSLPGCRRVYNVFHPFDPVAYRLEPLIDKRNTNTEPKIITHWKGGFRVQYQTKMLWKRIIDETIRTQKSVVDAVEASIEGIGLLDTTVNDLMDDGNEDDSSVKSNNQCQLVMGNLCEGRRVDYMLQEKEIENANEYLSALAAHSCYWGEKDLSLFIARQIFRSEHIKSENM